MDRREMLSISFMKCGLGSWVVSTRMNMRKERELSDVEVVQG